MKIQIEKFFGQINETSTQAHLFTLIFILILGFSLRFYGFIAGEGYHYFSINDEVSAVRVAMSFLAGEERAFYIGQPNFSNGHAPGPAFTLFTVMALKLVNGSVDKALMVMVFINTLVIYLIYRFARHLVQPGYALLAGFLFATSPWPVYYGPGLWNPIPLAFIGAVLFLSLWQTSQTDNSRTIIWVPLVAAVIPHFHMVGIFYIPAILLVLYLSPARINRAWFAAGILLGIAVYLPYIIGEVQHDWENTRKILSGSKEFSFSVLKIITAPATVLSNHPGRWVGDTFPEFIEFANSWFGNYLVLLIINLVSLTVSLGVIVHFLYRFFSVAKGHWKKPRDAYQQHPALFFMSIMLVVPLILFLFTGHNYSTRYTILIFPLLFLLPALFLQYAKNGKFKRLYMTTLPLMIIVNLYLPIAFFIHQEKQIKEEDYLITSFRKLETLRQHIKLHAGKDVLVSIDPTEYYKNAPVKFEKASKALADYVDIYEMYIGHREKIPEQQKHYLILQSRDATTSESDIAYKGNGFVITLKK